MQAECGSCSGWCSWCRGSWHEQDVARCYRKVISEKLHGIWNLNCLVLESLTCSILDGQIETFIQFFFPNDSLDLFNIASVWGTWSECLWGRWSLIQLVNVRVWSVHTDWPFSAQKQRDVQRLSEWREIFCWMLHLLTLHTVLPCIKRANSERN